MMLLGFLAVGGVVLVIARSASLDYQRTQDRLHEPGAETLVYDVPDGQDSVELTVALDRAGFIAVEDTARGKCRVLVECPRGRLEDRSRVRAVLQQVRSSGLVGDDSTVRTVQFADER